MEIWLDTTNIQNVQQAVKLGLLRGITTNPTLIAQSQREFELILEDLLHYQEGPIAVQVVGEETSEMVQQGQNLYAMSNRLIIKVPITKNGLEVIHLLSRQGVPTMATAIFHPSQALLAALTGADFIAPYLGAIEKMGESPWDVLRSIVQIFQLHRIKTKILGASISTVDDAIQCAEVGIFGVTLKDAVFEKLIETHPMTRKKVDEFANDWKSVNTPIFSV